MTKRGPEALDRDNQPNPPNSLLSPPTPDQTPSVPAEVDTATAAEAAKTILGVERKPFTGFVEPESVPHEGITGDEAAQTDKWVDQGVGSYSGVKQRVLPAEELVRLEGGQEPSIFPDRRGPVKQYDPTLGPDQRERADGGSKRAESNYGKPGAIN
jgi:hypothetical protein